MKLSRFTRHIRKMLLAWGIVILGALVLPQAAGEVQAAPAYVPSIAEANEKLNDPTCDTVVLYSGFDIDSPTTLNLVEGKTLKLDKAININSVLTITGNGTVQMLSGGSPSQMFMIKSGGTLNFESGKISTSNGDDTLAVNVQGTFNMNGGRIDARGENGGVFVLQDGTFIMRGNAYINSYSPNNAVAVAPQGTFDMKGGTINAASPDGIIIRGACTIEGNSLINHTGTGNAVHVEYQGATVTMKGGNIISNSGNAVFTGNSGKFIKEGGTITGAITQNPLVPGEYLLRATFKPNGGTGNIPYIQVTPGNPITVPHNTFTREGYTFKEWNTKADGTGTTYAEGATVTLNDALKLYAIWKNNRGPDPAPDPGPDPAPDPGPDPAPDPGPDPAPQPQRASYDDDDDYTVESRYSFGGWYLTLAGDAEGRITTGGEDDSFEHFSELQMDGGRLAQGSDYLVRRGSTIITIKKAVLDTLDDTTHYVAARFDDGDMIIPLNKSELKVKSSPKTGEV